MFFDFNLKFYTFVYLIWNVSLKKIISITLSLLVLLSSSGFSIAAHYCPMSKKTTFSWTEKESCCSKKKMKKKCCTNTKVKFEKIKDNYSASDVLKTPSHISSEFIFAFVHSYLFSSANTANSDLFLTDHAPPDKSVSRIILNRTILIWFSPSIIYFVSARNGIGYFYAQPSIYYSSKLIQ